MKKVSSADSNSGRVAVEGDLTAASGQHQSGYQGNYSITLGGKTATGNLAEAFSGGTAWTVSISQTAVTELLENGGYVSIGDYNLRFDNGELFINDFYEAIGRYSDDGTVEFFAPSSALDIFGRESRAPVAGR